MSSIYSDIQTESKKPNDIIAFELFIEKFLGDETHFKKLIEEKCHKYPGTLSIPSAAIFHRIEFGMLLANMSGNPTGALLDAIISRAKKWGLASEMHDSDVFLFNKDMCRITQSRGMIENVACGKLFVLNKYRNSIIRLAVRDSHEQESSGSGFLYNLQHKGVETQVVVTNKHVASWRDGKISSDQIKKIDAVVAGRTPLVPLQTFFSNRHDLAAIVVEGAQHFPPMFFDQHFLLKDIITAGYPKVSVTKENPLLFHGGQVNGTVRSRVDGNEYIIIDANVAPGNSGGPVIDEIGYVIGVVSLSSMGRYIDGLEMHHLVIPSNTISQFLAAEVIPNLYTSPLNPETDPASKSRLPAPGS